MGTKDKVLNFIIKQRAKSLVLLLAMCFLIALCGTFLGYKNVPVFAATNADATALSRPDKEDNLAYKFENPSLMCVDDEFLYVLDIREDGLSNDISVIIPFSLSTQKPQDEIPANNNITAMSAYGGKIYTLESGFIYEYTKTGKTAGIVSDEGGSSDILVNNEFVIGANGRKVNYFSRSDLLISKTVYLAANTKAHHISYLNDDVSGFILYAASDNSLNPDEKDDLQYYNMTDALPSVKTQSNLDKIYDIKSVIKENPTNSRLVVLHHEKISVYKKNIGAVQEVKSIPSSKNAHITAGKDIFVLSNKAITRYDSDLNNPVNFVVNPYYNTPSDLVTRKDKLIVSDTAKNNVVVYSTSGNAENDIYMPIATSIDYLGNTAIAHYENQLKYFDKDGNVSAPENGGVDENGYILAMDGFGDDASRLDRLEIRDIKFDGKNNLYMLGSDYNLYLKAKDSNRFNQIPLLSQVPNVIKQITAFDISPNNPYIFAVETVWNVDNTDPLNPIFTVTARNIKKYNPLNGVSADNGNLLSDAIYSSTDIVDVASSTEDGFYVLLSGNRILAFDADGNGGYVLRENSETGVNGEFNVSDAVDLTKITVSHINMESDDGGTSISYRDLIVIDSGDGSVKVIKANQLGTDSSLPDAPVLNDVENGLEFSDTNRIIRKIIKSGGCDVYEYENELSVIGYLNEGFYVIVPNFNPNSSFSYVYADRVKDGAIAGESVTGEKMIAGYVSNEFLSDPAESYLTGQELADNFPDKATIWRTGTGIYKYPSLQSPLIDGYNSLTKGAEFFEFLPFTFSTDAKDKIIYGYSDNFPKSGENDYKWYRLKIETADGKVLEGYVTSTDVSILGSDPTPGKRPQYNAEIIPLDKKNAPDIGAFVYKMNDDGSLKQEKGEAVVDDNFAPLPVGKKVEVVGTYNSSQSYTKIIFSTEYGLVTAYVPSGNIKYNGVNIVQIVAIVLIVITVIVLAALIIRSQIVKKKKLNKV